MAPSTLSLALLVAVAHTTAQSVPCGWRHPRAGTVRDAFYLDGGQYYENTWDATGNVWEKAGSPTSEPVPAGSLQRFNYSMPFGGSKSDLVNITGKMNLVAKTAGGNYDAPSYADGAMFVSGYELYTYGGLPLSAEKSSSTIFEYDLWPWDGQTTFVPGPNTNYQLPSDISNHITHGAGASIPSENLAFYFSGKHAVNDAPLDVSASAGQPGMASELVNHMLKVDMTSPGQAKWTNLPLDSSVEPRAMGQLVWVPVSKKGILLAIGGVTNPMDLENYVGPQDDTSNKTFTENIDIFDVNTESWSAQSSGADSAPGQLADFCAVVADAGNRHYDIFLYGGNNGMVLDGYDDDTKLAAQDAVWVLSVPEFVWTRVPGGNASHGRSGHVCSTPNPSQMLVVGGINQYDEGYCVTDGSLLDVFNLNTLQWAHEYDPTVGDPYQRNKVITDSISGQTPNAVSATNTLFSTGYPGQIVTYGPYQAQKVKDDSSKSKTNVGAIAGGVVGGVLVIAIILLLVWFCRPSKRQQRRIKKESDATSSTARGSNFINGWRHGVAPKDIISDTATEVDETPIQTAEVGGDTYFSPIRQSLLSQGSGRPNRYSGGSPQHSYAHPPRSPRSGRSGSVEHDGGEVFEVHGDSTGSPNRLSQTSAELSGLNIRAHPHYPLSIDGNLSTGRAGGSASDMSPPSHPSDRLGATSPGPVPSELSHDGDTDIRSTVSGHSASEKALPARPENPRSPSSISNELPITPPAVDESSRRPELGQSRNSNPISPLLNQDKPRPGHHRKGSSFSEMLLSPTLHEEGEADTQQTLLGTPTTDASGTRRKPLRSAYDENRRHMG